jgi:hypothetical protein
LEKLKLLNIGGSAINGSLPACIGDLSDVDTFSIVSTAMTGPIPREMCTWDSIKSFSIAHNLLTSLPSCLGQGGTLEHVNIASNDGFDGPLSEIWCRNTGLVTFQAMDNLFTGSIPSCFGRRSMPNLQRLDVTDNILSGTLPADLWNVTAVKIINNRIHGSLPSESNLLIDSMDLRNNYFAGTIPLSFCHWNMSQMAAAWKHTLETSISACSMSTRSISRALSRRT